ncbi:hypothetical protein [Mycobacterium sp. DL99]|uniref:hypothetical protein n=1 Tax=Mycobacterium sp. DL99 TaxID=2528957 RepID=UPI0010800602|nr:hypothetical protein [Mycobacterium sp. DL99]
MQDSAPLQHPSRLDGVTQATELTRQRISRGPLDWFPQKFEPGAIQGVGAKKLLGTPHVSTGGLLVRETAQNSWDARIGDRPVEFTINIRQLPEETAELLGNSVFTGSASGTQIRGALTADEVWAVEISDRGTVGLGGPVRNDRAIPPNSVTHFIDLIFNIGATKGDPTSGGTYGFGKSIAYMVSQVSAIIVWSRCATDKGPEDRLIASAIGDVFELDGYRYTGRHWWGRTIEGRPEPVVGPFARELGSQIFAKTFGDDELGTSILILAPELGAPGPEDDAEVLTEAVLWNLWPKLLPDNSGMHPMDVRVQVDGVDYPIPDPSSHPVLCGPVSCLRTVRAIQAGSTPTPSLFAVDVIEIKRYNEVLGHLALTKYPAPRGTAAEVEPSRAITLMRNGAELVVRQIQRSALAEPGFQWAGVFKPVSDLDPTFAKSEPPAHDDWSPASLQDKTQRSQVKLAIQRIQEAADKFVEPFSTTRPSQSSASAAAVGDMLAGLVTGSIGSAPTLAGGSKPSAGASRSSKARAQLGDPRWTDCGIPGWTRTTLPIRVDGGPSDGSRVQVEIGIGTDGGTERSIDPDYLRDGGWEGADGNATAVIMPGQSLEYWFDSSDEVAIDITVRIVDEGSHE